MKEKNVQKQRKIEMLQEQNPGVKDTNDADDLARSAAEGKTGMPLDIALSLLRPDELEKLRNYVTAYMAKHHSGEIQ